MISTRAVPRPRLGQIIGYGKRGPIRNIGGNTGPSVVQSTTIPGAASGTLTTGITSGSSVFVVVQTYNASNVTISTSSVTVNGQSLTKLMEVSTPYSSQVSYFSIWGAANNPGGTTVSASITNGTFNPSNGLEVIEVANLGTAWAIDKQVSANSASGTAVASGSTAATADPNEFVIGAIATANDTTATPTGLASTVAFSFYTYGWAGYTIATSSGGTYGFSATQSATGVWAAGVVTITSNVPLSMTTTSLPNAATGIAYSQSVAASGGTAPYTYSVSSGSLPSWASLNSSTGAITGTPSTGQPGSTFTIEVTDNVSATATKSLSIDVHLPVTIVGTVGTASGTSSPLTSVYGQTPTANNVLLALVAAGSTTAETANLSTSATGWSRLPSGSIGNNASGTSKAIVDAWVKTAVGSDSAPTFSQTLSGSPELTCHMYELNGADISAFLDGSIVVQQTGSGTSTVTFSLVHPGAAGYGEFAATIMAMERASATLTWTETGSGWTSQGKLPASGASVLFAQSNSLTAPSPGSSLTDAGHWSTDTTAVGAGLILLVKGKLVSSDLFTGAIKLKKMVLSGASAEKSSVTAAIKLKKMVVSISGVKKDIGSATIKLKKMVLAASSTEKAVVTAAIKLKKMVVAVSSSEKAVVTAAIKLKKMVVSISCLPPFATSIAGSGTAQHFVDQYGNPFFLRADTAWGLPQMAGQNGGATTWETDIATYCSTRGSQGFNGFLIAAVGDSTTSESGGDNNGDTWDSVSPFSSPGVLNNTYWDRIDYLLTQAEINGLTVVVNIAPQYSMDTSGCAFESWTDANYQAYGTAIGGRYASAPNIIWTCADDYYSTMDGFYDDIKTHIQSAGDTHLWSIENMPESTSRQTLSGTTLDWGTANAQYNYCYSYAPSYLAVEIAYQETSPICVIHGDGYYDGDAGELSYLRNQVWWSLSDGVRGYIYGREHIWPWGTSSLSDLTTGQFDKSGLQTAWNAFTALPGWHTLVPDTSSVLVTAGRGTKALTSDDPTYLPTSTQNTYVTASVNPDGTLAVIYIPAANSTTITVDDTSLVSGYSAKWLDPASGATTNATKGSTYTKSSANSAGDHDWVLVLAQATGVSVTGAISLKKMVAVASSTEKAVVTAAIKLKKMVVAASSSEKAVVTAAIKLKKMVVAASSAEKTAATVTIKLKKMVAAASSSEKAVVTAAIKLKKMILASSGTANDTAAITIKLKKMVLSASSSEKAVITAAIKLKKLVLSGFETLNVIYNNAEGGTNGTNVVAGNSGGSSGTAFDSVGIGTGAAITFDNAHSAHGSLSYKLTTPATAQNADLVWTTSLTAGTILKAWFRVYLYRTANPASSLRVVSVRSGSTARASVAISTSGKVTLLNAAGSIVNTSSTTLPLNQWFRLEGFVVGDASIGQIECKIFTTSMDETSPDETVTSSTSLNNGGTINRVDFGNPVSAASDTMWLDDMGVSTNGYIGPVKGGTLSGSIKLKKMVVASSGSEKSVVTAVVKLKKMSLSGASAEKTIGSGVVSLKKMRLSVVATEKPSISGTISLKKMQLAIASYEKATGSGTIQLHKQQVHANITVGAAVGRSSNLFIFSPL